jgi:protein-arginine kinase
MSKASRDAVSMRVQKKADLDRISADDPEMICLKWDSAHWGSMDVKDEDVVKLAGILPGKTNLQSIYLRGNKGVSKKGLEKLIKALPKCGVFELYLQDTSVEYKLCEKAKKQWVANGARRIAANDPAVVKVDWSFQGTRVDDEDLAKLAGALASNEHLIELRLANNRRKDRQYGITDDGARRLNSALASPKCCVAVCDLTRTEASKKVRAEIAAICEANKSKRGAVEPEPEAAEAAEAEPEPEAECEAAPGSEAEARAEPEPETSIQSGDPAVQTVPAGDVVAQVAELLAANPNNICLNTFDESYYASLSEELKGAFLKCLASGIENPDSGMGIYACQPEDYDRFKPFFSKALAKYHGVAEDAKHVNDWSLEGLQGLPEDGVLDIAKLGLPELSMRVRTGRNLKEFPLPGAMTKEQRCDMENRMLRAFEVLFADPAFGGKYCSFTPGHPKFVDAAEYQTLVDAHIAFKDMSADKYLLSAGIAADWPHGRGVYISEDKGFIIWVGEEDHLRIMCMKQGTVLNEVFDRLKGALDVVDGIESIGGFAISPDYGVVTSCPTNLGTAMRASLHIQLPNLTADGTDTQAKAICKPLGLSVRGLGGEHTPIGVDGTVDISPSKRFMITEAEIITALYKGIEKLKAAEDAAGAAEPAVKTQAGDEMPQSTAEPGEEGVPPEGQA